MTAGIAPARSGFTTISTLSRVYGFGSIYGKTVRDSRLAFIIAACTASAASTARPFGIRAWPSPSPPACSAGWRS